MSVRLIVICCFLVAGLTDASQFSVSASIGDFHVAVSNYYRVPEREVIVIRERRIPDDEIPVVLFIAQRARVAPAVIIDLRRAGRSWMDISVRYGLSPEIFYVPVTVVAGPPYGRAYGHYKKPKHQWKTIVLADSDVVNLVNLRFLADHHHVAPERVIELRGRNADFIAIHTEIGRGRPVKAVVVDRDHDDDRPGKGKGKGRGRGRDK